VNHSGAHLSSSHQTAVQRQEDPSSSSFALCRWFLPLSFSLSLSFSFSRLVFLISISSFSFSSSELSSSSSSSSSSSRLHSFRQISEKKKIIIEFYFILSKWKSKFDGEHFASSVLSPK